MKLHQIERNSVNGVKVVLKFYDCGMDPLPLAGHLDGSLGALSVARDGNQLPW